jgi:hypothetical protein
MPDARCRHGSRGAVAGDFLTGSSTAEPDGLPIPIGAPLALTKAEYALLTAFLDAPQRPLSREPVQPKSSKGSIDNPGDSRHKEPMSRSFVSGRKMKPTTKLIAATAIGYQSPE